MAKKIMLPVLDDRLMLIASMVREGAVPLDVGTDHAYVPIYLIKSGICRRAVASDVNRQPLTNACANAQRFGVFEKIHFCLGNGIRDIHPERYDVTDIIIAGMGGELIAEIIDKSEYTRIPGVRLILQPMSSLQELRGYLAEMGYATITEKLCRAADKYYTCIVCEYDGVQREVPPVRLLVGDVVDDEADPLVNGFLDSTARKLRRKIKGRLEGGLPVVREEEMLRELAEMAAARGHTLAND
ncbi:MAG: SAM-dependent methyltransferase [Clostridia bacterium]|nr:SAM-dependent methyltransferase [Clostridia bacterium]MBR5447010.1 SAM-dependent methyltransferase [Clostridia bacterium]